MQNQISWTILESDDAQSLNHLDFGDLGGVVVI